MDEPGEDAHTPLLELVPVTGDDHLVVERAPVEAGSTMITIEHDEGRWYPDPPPPG